MRTLGGGCQMPIGAAAAVTGGSGHGDGDRRVARRRACAAAEARGSATDPQRVGTAVADDLLAQGAGEILADVQRAHAAVEGIQP